MASGINVDLPNFENWKSLPNPIRTKVFKEQSLPITTDDVKFKYIVNEGLEEWPVIREINMKPPHPLDGTNPEDYQLPE
jgi:hypothetical protein